MTASVKDVLGYHRQAVYGLLALAAVTYLLSGSWYSALDTCYSDRFAIRAEQVDLWEMHRSISFFVFRCAVFALVAFLAILSLWSEDKAKSSQPYKPSFVFNWNHFCGAAFLLLWYGSTYALLTAMKVILGDSICGGGKSNSISGHFSFFIFYGASLPYIAFILLSYGQSGVSIRSVLSPQSVFHFKQTLLALLYSIFVVCGLFTLSQTWSWGYHSARQIIYGIVLGAASHLALRYILKAPTTTNRPLPTIPASYDEFMGIVKDLSPVSYLALFNVVTLLLVILTTSDLPFNIYEIFGFLFLWPSLAYCFFFHQQGRFNTRCQLD